MKRVFSDICLCLASLIKNLLNIINLITSEAFYFKEAEKKFKHVT